MPMCSIPYCQRIAEVVKHGQGLCAFHLVEDALKEYAHKYGIPMQKGYSVDMWVQGVVRDIWKDHQQFRG